MGMHKQLNKEEGALADSWACSQSLSMLAAVWQLTSLTPQHLHLPPCCVVDACPTVVQDAKLSSVLDLQDSVLEQIQRYKQLAPQLQVHQPQHPQPYLRAVRKLPPGTYPVCGHACENNSQQSAIVERIGAYDQHTY